MNPITGEYEITIAGKNYILRYDWQALSEVAEAHGDTPNFFDPNVIASIAASGLKRRYPEITADKIIKASPPLVPFAVAVQTAMQWAMFGSEALPAENIKKKTSPGKGGLLQRIKQRLGRAWVRKSFGA